MYRTPFIQWAGEQISISLFMVWFAETINFFVFSLGFLVTFSSSTLFCTDLFHIQYLFCIQWHITSPNNAHSRCAQSFLNVPRVDWWYTFHASTPTVQRITLRTQESQDQSHVRPAEADEMPMRLGGSWDPKAASPDESTMLEAKEISHDGTALKYHCYVCVYTNIPNIWCILKKTVPNCTLIDPTLNT